MRSPLQIIFILFLILLASAAAADTIRLKSGGEPLNGLVVDEYADRVILSTVDGEKEILRSDIKDVLYDTPEQGLSALGRSYEAIGRLEDALTYYQRALEANPEYKEARDAVTDVSVKIQIARMSSPRGSALKPVAQVNIAQSVKEKELADKFGLSLFEESGLIKIAAIKESSPAKRAGFRENDAIVAVKSVPLRYAKTEEVIDRLLGQRYSQGAIKIERYIAIPTKSRQDPGITIALEPTGPVVNALRENSPADKAGVKAGDLIYVINGVSTRYKSLRAVNTMLGEGPLELSIRREITIER